jgi:hypothetical protein
MSSICELRIPNVRSRLEKQSHGRFGSEPINLLAFLKAENCSLQNTVAELERDIMALRQALQNN